MLGTRKMPKWGDDSEWNGINGVSQCAPPAAHFASMAIPIKGDAVDLADWLNLVFLFAKIVT